MNAEFNVHDIRQAMLESLPIGIAESEELLPAHTYVPRSHFRALEPGIPLVEGIRGSGKSFWWKALSSEQHRKFVSAAFPQAGLKESMLIGQGFGASEGSASVDAPSKDELAHLVEKFSPRATRAIWKAVVAHKAGFGEPFPQRETWERRIAWVLENPEAYDRLLVSADTALEAADQTRLVLFDALDRLADDWKGVRPLAKALLQVALEMRSTRRIRLKLFVRPDMLEDREIMGFPDASKLLAQKAALTWNRADLYALLFQCIGNAQRGGDAFRKYTSAKWLPRPSAEPASFLKSLTPVTFIYEWNLQENVWVLPPYLAIEAGQEHIFIALAGKAMSAASSGARRGKPYTWLVNHLQDGRDQVSPRSFCVALRKAAEKTPDDYHLVLYFKAIHEGVQEASKIRVEELAGEDYPWLEEVMKPLRGRLTVPCERQDIIGAWKEAQTLNRLTAAISKSAVKLPPQHLDEGPLGVLEDLEKLGVIQHLTDGRIQMPDVYRVAFGLGRRGGIKPVR